MIKAAAANCKEISNPISNWIQSVFYCIGLNTDLDPYIFQPTLALRKSDIELRIHNKKLALDHNDKRKQYFKNNKALANNF